MDKAILERLLHRPPNSNKYDFGHVLIIGGSAGTVGAPLLSAKAALRTGAGLVTIAAPAVVAGKLERRVEEIMTLSLPQDQTQVTETLINFINKRHVNAVVVGPGLSEQFAPACRAFLSDLKQPIVLDAGGLLAFKGRFDELKTIAQRTSVIITPHTGEFQKLTGESATDNEALNLAQKLKLTVILKGHRTLVVHPKGQTYHNATGNPGMATAGSGDVLTGVIAGLIAQSVPADQAAETGVFLHGLAGDMAKQDKTEPGMEAGDIIENLPDAIKKLALKNDVAL